MTEQTEEMDQEVSIMPPDPDAADTSTLIQEPGSAGTLISRTRSNRFLPADATALDPSVVVGRGFLRSKATPQKQQLSRERKIAGDLPAWDPMPPGEVAVRRRARD
jgi:hypothetical protein